MMQAELSQEIVILEAAAFVPANNTNTNATAWHDVRKLNGELFQLEHARRLIDIFPTETF